MWEYAVPIASQVIGGMFGMGSTNAASRAQRAAEETNMRIAEMNQRDAWTTNMNNEAFMREYNRDQSAERERMLDMMKEGYTDPTSGTTVKYEPGRGWVTTYSPRAAQIMDAQQNEAIQNLLVDQPIARRTRVLDESRRNKEGSLADAIMAELSGPDPYDNARITADVGASRRRGINDAFDRQTDRASTQALRAGTTGGNMIARMARERAAALSDADAGSYVEGLQLAEGLRSSRNSRLGSSYNLMANRAKDASGLPTPYDANPSAAAMSLANSARGQTSYIPSRTQPIQTSNAPLNFRSQPNYGDAYQLSMLQQGAYGINDLWKQIMNKPTTMDQDLDRLRTSRDDIF